MSHLNRWTAIALAMGGAASAQAPVPVVIPDEPTCAHCRISVRTLVTLGTDDGVGALNGKPMSVNVDSRGRYWVFQELEPPTVFHADGRVDRLIGRKGSGPGEFRSANGGIVVGDSMLVLDWLESRATMMGPDLAAGRIIRLRPGIGDIMALRWPTLLITQVYMSESRPPNSTLHRLSMEKGETQLLTSFGPRGTGGSMGNQQVRQLLGYSGEGIWTAYWGKPQFMLWDERGNLRKSLIRRLDWFTGEAQATLGWSRTPPTPATGPIREDDEGLLWVFIHTPAPTWREAWETPPVRVGGGREYLSRAVIYDKLYRTHLEVIDPRTARVVASLSIDGYVMESLPGRRAAMYEVDDNGFPRVRIVAFTLSGR